MRGVPRPRLYEIVGFMDTALIVLLVPLIANVHFDFLAAFTVIWPTLLLFAGLLVGGVVVRLLLARLRGGRAVAVRLVRSYVSSRTLFDLVRLVLVTALVSYAYSWLKVFVPVLNPALFDDVLYAVDNAIHFGVNPNRFLLALFPSSSMRHFMDFEYAAFFAAMMAGFGWFASSASMRERARFAAGFAFLWLAGSWIYLAVPSLGPCYVFPDEYEKTRADFPLQTSTQAVLLHQYGIVRGVHKRPPVGVDLVQNYGVAAMPSLHVGALAFLALWARRRCRALFVLYTVLTALTFLGSLITGWHYAVDGYAGVLLAFGVAWIGKSARP